MLLSVSHTPSGSVVGLHPLGHSLLPRACFPLWWREEPRIVLLPLWEGSFLAVRRVIGTVSLLAAGSCLSP